LYQVLKRTTGITGLAVHPDPLPELTKTYESTLTILSSIPSSSVYRQGVEALTRRKLNIVQGASGDVTAVEKQLEEGQIEESLDIAQDELTLAAKMVEWKALVTLLIYVGSWPNTAETVGNLWKRNLSEVSGSISGRAHHHEMPVLHLGQNVSRHFAYLNRKDLQNLTMSSPYLGHRQEEEYSIEVIRKSVN
jgi:NADH dehydrogenase (ubiquinone) 1 alpha subcomplex subunit 5